MKSLLVNEISLHFGDASSDKTSLLQLLICRYFESKPDLFHTKQTKQPRELSFYLWRQIVYILYAPSVHIFKIIKVKCILSICFRFSVLWWLLLEHKCAIYIFYVEIGLYCLYLEKILNIYWPLVWPIV